MALRYCASVSRRMATMREGAAAATGPATVALRGVEHPRRLVNTTAAKTDSLCRRFRRALI
jgi:hypothetical protein